MADESADVSNIEQFAFCVRFKEKSDADVHIVTEEFLSFVSTTSITGEALHALLTTEIRKHDLSWVRATMVQGIWQEKSGVFRPGSRKTTQMQNTFTV